MSARPIGEDELAPGQFVDGGGQLGMLPHHGEIEVVHVIEKGLRVHPMHLHQAAKGGAELAVVGFLQMPRVHEWHAEEAGDELTHLLVDLGEQVAVGRIERVVEIEDPHPRRLEAAPPYRLSP